MVILISICCVECVHIASGVVVHHIMPFLKIDTMRTLDCALVGLDIALAEDSKEVNKIRTHKKRALSLSSFSIRFGMKILFWFSSICVAFYLFFICMPLYLFTSVH